MNKIDNQTTLPNYKGQRYQAEHMKNEAVKKHIPAESFDNLALRNRASITMKIIFQSVSSHISAKFEKFNYTQPNKNVVQSNIIAKEPLINSESSSAIFDFEAVARTVMDFVGGSILAAQANGASDDELKEMFEQGRAGANLGIDQAMGDLKDLSIFDDELGQGIEKSRDLINKNIDDLYKKIFPAEKNSKSNIDIESPKIRNAALNSELYVSNSKKSDLSITTTDGDIVSISFSELQEYGNKKSARHQESNRGVSENYTMVSSEYNEVNFSYSVDGDLDDEEKAAIEALIKDVNSLQKDFFSGNVVQAFEKSVELGFDNDQIANFSMDMQQTKTSYVSQSYTEIAEFGERDLPSVNKELRPLIDFLGQFKQLQEAANTLLSKKEDAFGQLLDAVFKAEFGENKEVKDKFNKVIDTIKPDNKSK
ncbi:MULTISPECIES: DUF5610 domain-containing protein [unclassified Colwellia]|uniref:DUF5610 domain-containing protein n=1 Tax=unclassified Colwellia TaxID=196834 RepID=UPI0015F37DBC|nr:MULTISPECIES: DUF5610 domain-containing protein [unclassified Colwellia]MBA6232067.1 DUF5610 domain-containing protein [Colwellia sp. MB02u-7]MBA6237235.1 DUF5610 domain-containing protein [Colwellia sp. MB02u-11]MBA6254677.1 DUF5610 domain-containing protein [Colwellia sp. MB3u-28]MBA6260405.1 DUF5610 domain-containing protein [Colwellia sp. MB3u-41]MBA6300198.1 DUF5610 domain-containing protein [Colwellia sp. MB3u-22]